MHFTITMITTINRILRNHRFFVINFIFCFLGSFLTLICVLIALPNPNNPSDFYSYSNPNAENSFLHVLILTAPGNLDQRNTIRQTWLPLRFQIDAKLHDSLQNKIQLPIYNDKGFVEPLSLDGQEALRDVQPRKQKPMNRSEYQSIPVTYSFVVGTNGLTRSQTNQIHYEQSNENDLIIFPNLIDSYSNLTHKLLMSVTSATFKYKFKYLLKCDDDTYVNIDQLTAELFVYDQMLEQHNYEPNPVPELYWGYFNGKANIKKGGKWQETNFRSCDLYSPYALGGGYVISVGIARYIDKNAKWLSPYVSEDVSMGTWLSHLRHVYRKHDVRFDSGYLPRSCKPYHLLVHKRSEREMKRLRGGDLCSFEDTDLHGQKRPMEYFYDWAATPSKCCVPNLQ